MKISTKYIIEFSVEQIIETIAVCNSISSVREYLIEKFKITDDMDAHNNEGYLLVINLDYGKIQVRKVDFVED